MYHVEGDTQLRVVRRGTKLAENAELLRHVRLVILEHVLPTTAEFLRHLREAGVDIHAVIAKPYSIDEATYDRMVRDGVNVLREDSYQSIESKGLARQCLRSAIRKSRRDDRSVIVVDVGGYFAAPLAKLAPDGVGNLAGVVEDTTFGHLRYAEQLSLRESARGKARGFPVPVCSVARSELKEIEARFVGRDAVVAIESMLRKIGVSITGRNALVIGYGMIGKNVARTLRGYDLNVYVYDCDDRQLLRAFTDGFHIHKKVVLLRHADVIFAATGSEAKRGMEAMSLEEIEDCKHGVILASVGSRTSEFDVAGVQEQAIEKPTELIGDEAGLLVRYRMPNSKHVVVARRGAAVNFYLPTMPVEILDLVFSEILECMLAVLRGYWSIGTADPQHSPPLSRHVLNEAPSPILDRISKEWLRSVNMEAQA